MKYLLTQKSLAMLLPLFIIILFMATLFEQNAFADSYTGRSAIACAVDTSCDGGSTEWNGTSLVIKLSFSANLTTRNYKVTLSMPEALKNEDASGALSFSYKVETTASAGYGKATVTTDFCEYEVTGNLASAKSGTEQIGTYEITSWDSNSSTTIDLSAYCASKRSTTSITVTLSNIVFTPSNDAKLTMGYDGMSYTVNYTPVVSATDDNGQEPITAAGTTIKYIDTDGITISDYDSNYHLVGLTQVLDGETTTIYPNANGVCKPAAGATVTPIFAYDADGIGPFKVGDNYYWTMDSAFYVAKTTSNKLVILVENYTVPAGTYDLDASCQFLIPYDSSYTADFDTEPGTVNGNDGGTYTTPSQNVCLTISDGATINCYGSVNVNAQMYVLTNQRISCVTGPYGAIDVSKGGVMNFEGGSQLYAYGYIGGQGTVNAAAGSKVYEMFQICDWRGGTASSAIYDEANGNTFLFSHYYLQNVEAQLNVFSGATLYGVVGVTAGIDQEVPVLGTIKVFLVEHIAAPIIGVGEGLFQMNSSRTKDYISLKYDADTDRMNVLLSGAVTTGSINIKISIAIISMDIKSSDYICPLPMNFSITVASGSTVSLGYRYKLLPDAEIIIEDGASMTIESGGALYLYDRDDWVAGTYSHNDDVEQLSYVHAKKGKPITRTATNDAKLQVDGTLTAIGAIYTTSQESTGGSAAITGTGIIHVGAHGSVDLIEYNDNKEFKTVGCIPAVGNVLGSSTNPTQLAENTTYYGFNWNGGEYWSTSGAILDAMSLNMEGQVELNLKFYIHPTLVEGLTVHVSEDYNAIATEGSELGANNVWSKLLSKLTQDEKGRYVITQGIAAGEMTGKVNVSFSNGETTYTIYDKYLTEKNHVASVEKSAVDYISRILEENSNEKLVALCRAAAIYGGFAQEKFGVDTDNPAYLAAGLSRDEAIAAFNDLAFSEYTSTIKKSDDVAVSPTGFRVDLNAYAFIRIYFSGTITGVKESNAQIGSDENGYYVDILNIPVAMWDENYTVTVTTTEGGNIEITTSVLAWAQSYIQANENVAENEAQVLMAKAMFLLNQKADAYFGTT